MYAPPSISASGLTIPSYNDILNNLISNFQTIYGQNVYLANDSSDYQFLSVLALKISDAVQGLQLEYNSRSPWTAIGSPLDSIIKLNGLTRKSASYSTCVVILTGTPGTTITNGIVGDINGNKWDLGSTPIPIGSDGTATATAICETIGAITALAGNIINIMTPQSGWTSVTNIAAASVGQPVETDSQLRARQALSTMISSETMLAGTIAAIAATPGVTRYNVVENYTNAYDGYGNPPHSISAVVEGGTQLAVATAIYNNRGIGCYTNGTTSVPITDPDTGQSININYFLPTYVPIYVSIGIHKLVGYTTATATAIKAAIAAYLNSLQIGENLTISGLYGAALSVMPNLSIPIFSIYYVKAGIVPSPLGTTDISISFNSVTQGIAGTSPSYITLQDNL
jgi:uncharacterized phage protein gp47/JayE